MAQDQIGLAKVKDDDKGEQFMIMLKEGDKAERAGYFMTTFRPMDETETRAELAKMGNSDLLIEQMIHRARAHFKGEPLSN